MSTPTNSATDAVVEEVVSSAICLARCEDSICRGQGRCRQGFNEADRVEATAAISAFLRAARQQGWQMVPMTPDRAMDEAPMKQKLGFGSFTARTAYQAMLQAAPRCPWESDG